MKKNNVIIFALLALASAFFLWLWYALSFNTIDAPLDLVLSIVWWAAIIAAVLVIIKMEKTRRERIRTVYVSDNTAFNSEKGMFTFEQTTPMPEAIASIIANLKYDFSRKDFPEKDAFQVKYFVRTKEFEVKENQDQAPDAQKESAVPADNSAQTQRFEAPSGQAPTTPAAQQEQKKWAGEVVIVDTKEEKPFDTPEELATILASLEHRAA